MTYLYSPGVVAWVIVTLALCVLPSNAIAAERAVALKEMIQSVRTTAGIGVQIGCGDGALAAQWAEGSKLLAHVLESDASKMERARTVWQERGLSGQITVEHWTGSTLPYPDNLVNVLVLEDAEAVVESERIRVLAPDGAVWSRQGEDWLVRRKGWPAEFDEWTHWRHGADGNMVSGDRAVAVPTGLRWVAGPPQDAGGKRWYYDHVLVSARGRNFYVYEDSLCARDAFNGSLLWRRPLRAHLFQESAASLPSFLQSAARPAARSSKVRPVAVGERLYVAASGKLLGLVAATGETALEFGPVASPRELLVVENVLVVTEEHVVRAYRSGGTRLWEAPVEAQRIVAGDGRLYCVSSNQIAALDLGTGNLVWEIRHPKPIPASTCTYHEGILVLEKSTWRDEPDGCGVLAYSGKEGRLLWKQDYRPDMTHWQEARAFFAQDLLWLQVSGSKIVGVDPQTGHRKMSWGSRGKHCATPVATERYFIAPECEFTDFATGSQERARMFKSACRLPFIPANGLLYTFPVQCECYPMLRGYMGLSSDPVPADRPLQERLEKVTADAELSGELNPALEWPMYRHDFYRSGSTPMALPERGLKQRWATAVIRTDREAWLAQEWGANPFVRGLVTPPVVAGRLVCVALPDQHRVLALDLQTGTVRWSFASGGRVDTPPTLYRGLCLFGSHDGWVYCLDAQTGALHWRFSAAPQPTRVPAYGQLESLWPVTGSLLIENGIAYGAAGRHPKADGGVRVFAVRAQSGEVLWETRVNELVLRSWYSPMIQNLKLGKKQKVGLDFEPFDLLVKDGDFVSMSRWRFEPKTGQDTLALASLEYDAGGVDVPRGLWGYGIRQTKPVQAKPPAVFNREKIHTGETGEVALLLAGKILVSASADGKLTVGSGGDTYTLPAPVVHDGLAAAYHRLYVATQDGQVICFE